ncbi:MAG TPA: hemolysin III family protein [Stellaceae bacterium]|jgi:hemolysin III|nr:hemolysin III family protein [Stellaceae bacterium]
MGSSLEVADDLASAGVHAGGLVLALIFSLCLLRRAEDPVARFAIRALGLAWLILYLASISYHLTHIETAWDPLTTALDDGAIFVAIAGTYTPVALLILPPADGRFAVRLLWCAGAAGAATGFVMILTGDLSWYQPSVLVICSIYGWGPAIAYCRTLRRAMPRGAGFLILASGLVYVAGSYFYRDHRLPWHHTYWHMAVVIGCLLDFTAIAALLAATRRRALAPARSQDSPVRR